MVTFLKKPEGSAGFHQIVDFFNSTHIKYALTENPTIYVSLIHQFWQTASASTSENREMEITTTIDGRVKTVIEASIRRHLKLEDSDGIITLPNTEIFKQLALMGSLVLELVALSPHHPPHISPTLRSPIRQETKVPQLSSPPHINVADEAASTSVDVRHGGAATTVTNLDTGQGSGNINKTPSMPHDLPLPRGHTLGSDEGRMQQHELMDFVTKLSDRCESLETDKESLCQEDQPGDQLGVFSAAKVLADAAKNVHTYTKRRKSVSTGSGGVSTASRLFSTTKESVSTVGASMPQRPRNAGFERAVRLQEHFMKREIEDMTDCMKKVVVILILKKWVSIQATIEADEELAQRIQAEEREKYSEAEKARLLQKTNEASGSVQEQLEEEEKKLSQEDLQQMMMVVPVEEVYIEALQINRDKLQVLVKERFVCSIDPLDDKIRTLWVELKRLFEPDTDDILWKLQIYMHDLLTWRLYDTCGVHHVSTDRGHDIFMLVKKDYPLTRGLLTLMLCNKLQVDQYSEMADNLLRKMDILANRPRQ
ncbi:hypothetical protein Tco_1079053 [Tanacetum coccineum]|uniref:Xylulose kinase-1 n=1 Tax=Tanacetum coccineum TaxID=301880 RepID=A0ABQ5HR29_9ASTR